VKNLEKLLIYHKRVERGLAGESNGE